MGKGPTIFVRPWEGVGPYPKELGVEGMSGFIFFLKSAFWATVVGGGVTGATSGHWEARWS